jgi:phospholipid transport system substrate-binding protein
MTTAIAAERSRTMGAARVTRFVNSVIIVTSLWLIPALPACAGDAAVEFMQKVGRELLAASRTHSPSIIAGVIQRYGDVNYIGMYSLGGYRAQLTASDKPNYIQGMVRFISRYAATESAKYPVARVTWSPQSFQGGAGLMVDCQVILADGSNYDVRWLLSKNANGYKVRDAMVLGFWMTPFLKKLFENYIGENGGSVRALLVALNR